MSKTVWYLLHYATTPKSGTRNRPYYLSAELNTLGHKAYVIAANSHHYLYEDVSVSGALELSTLDNVPFIWLKTPKYKKNGLMRVVNMFAYGYSLWRQQKALIEITGKPDVIIVSSPHAFFYPIAYRLAKRYGAKLVFEMRDLWPLALTQMNQSLKYNPLTWYMSAIEHHVCRHADFVVSLLPNAYTYLKTKGLTENRFCYIPNGISFTHTVEQQACRSEVAKQITDIKSQGKFVIGYLGTHGNFNALEQLIDAMALLQKKEINDIHVFLSGDGSKKYEWQARAASLRNITFLDVTPTTQAQDFLSKMDALFIGWYPLPIYEYGISPDKIFSYMLAAKPIVHAINTKHDPTQSAECAFVVPAGDVETLARTLTKVSQIPPERLTALGENGKRYLLAQHDYKKLAARYSELF